jgi:hypothetical protein
MKVITEVPVFAFVPVSLILETLEELAMVRQALFYAGVETQRSFHLGASQAWSLLRTESDRQGIK